MLNVVIESRNGKNLLDFCVETIFSFSTNIEKRIFIANMNEDPEVSSYSTKWADVIVFDFKRGTSFGSATNTMIELGEISEDILFVFDSYLLSPNLISNLCSIAHDNREIGLVGVMTNTDILLQYSPSDTYEDCLKKVFANNPTSQGLHRCMGIEPGVVLLPWDTFLKIGKFDEGFESRSYCFSDYQYRILTNNKIIVFDEKSYSWSYSSRGCWAEYIDIDARRMEEKWKMHYFNQLPNLRIVDKINKDYSGAFSVLEIGCDCGATLCEIKARYPYCKVLGTDINEASVNVARNVAETWVNNIEEKNLGIEPDSLDYIIFGDVLEHLRDPKGAIEYCKYFLKEGGQIIANIPNVMHISVIKQLLNGNFTYTETGLLDKTHIHFFTYNEIVNMFSTVGYKNLMISENEVAISDDDEQLINSLLALSDQSKRFMYKAFQYCVKAEKRESVSCNILMFEGSIPIIKYQVDMFSASFASLGYSVKVLPKETEKKEIAKIISDWADLIFVVNNDMPYDLSKNENSFGKPIVDYLFDHPMYYYDFLNAVSSRLTLACVDKNHKQFAERFLSSSINGALFSPLAGEEMGITKMDWDERPMEVFFAGTMKSFEDLPNDLFSDEVKELLLSNPNFTSEGAIEYIFRKKNPCASETEILSAIEKYKRIDVMVTSLYKYSIISSLVMAGIDVYVCGNLWENTDLIDNPHFHYLGSVSKQECLKLMGKSKFVLNLLPWFRDGGHDRIFDGALAGCLCISDGNQYLEDNFTDGEDIVFYELQNYEELPQIIRFYEENTSLTKEIIAKCRNKVKENHLWINRTEKMVKDLIEIGVIN